MSRHNEETSIRQDGDGPVAARQRWMRVLARTPAPELERALRRCGGAPDYEFLRRPETGLVMVRGRMDAVGRRFNLGEMTMTRCAVRTADGRTGFAFVAGREPRRAELAAVLDAVLQDEARAPALAERVVAPLEAARQRLRAQQRVETSATRVEFFTMVRGED